MRILIFSYCILITCCVNSAFGEEYKVFRGEGFSFGYPVNWEEGLSQAETTKALVRAIHSKTGYSASCNINVGFVEGLDEFSQTQINLANSRIHDLKYLSRIKQIFPDLKILTYDTETYLSNQPASSIEYQTTVKTRNASQLNSFFQIMTIRKPYRYVLTCIAAPEYFVQAQDAINLIASSFLITKNLGVD